ncbi:hypothetical protein [Pedobacter sp. UYP30]|uniref:hypothetical protein n=1 Tax=Pedobacter sp. UYP30 TaxID=1756400 RepID=UPI0033955904
MYLFIKALCKVKSGNYPKTSAGLFSTPLANSCFRRIQCFMAEAGLPIRLVAKLIFRLLSNQDSFVRIRDKTNWRFWDMNINNLTLWVSDRNVVIPLIFNMLDKRANSNTAERIALVKDSIDWFGTHRLPVGR